MSRRVASNKHDRVLLSTTATTTSSEEALVGQESLQIVHLRPVTGNNRDVAETRGGTNVTGTFPIRASGYCPSHVLHHNCPPVSAMRPTIRCGTWHAANQTAHSKIMHMTQSMPSLMYAVYHHMAAPTLRLTQLRTTSQLVPLGAVATARLRATI
jgi:hypothetical protein